MPLSNEERKARRLKIRVKRLQDRAQVAQAATEAKTEALRKEIAQAEALYVVMELHGSEFDAALEKVSAKRSSRKTIESLLTGGSVDPTHQAATVDSSAIGPEVGVGADCRTPSTEANGDSIKRIPILSNTLEQNSDRAVTFVMNHPDSNANPMGSRPSDLTEDGWAPTFTAQNYPVYNGEPLSMYGWPPAPALNNRPLYDGGAGLADSAVQRLQDFRHNGFVHFDNNAATQELGRLAVGSFWDEGRRLRSILADIQLQTMLQAQLGPGPWIMRYTGWWSEKATGGKPIYLRWHSGSTIDYCFGLHILREGTSVQYFNGSHKAERPLSKAGKSWFTYDLSLPQFEPKLISNGFVVFDPAIHHQFIQGSALTIIIARPGTASCLCRHSPTPALAAVVFAWRGLIDALCTYLSAGACGAIITPEEQNYVSPTRFVQRPLAIELQARLSQNDSYAKAASPWLSLAGFYPRLRHRVAESGKKTGRKRVIPPGSQNARRSRRRGHPTTDATSGKRTLRPSAD
ncbi:hypothetical protein OOU_Y34scaffold00243g1 [Pyricularia oryzae Y34]|uniref:Uncharacterized protein n=1 Tax=Pyricularia oryzae (strain Y34) TaxID=1143189 RepID=A0AA97P4R4_PYRO3|nr:hypothetical protein OOU_Y34scaffold00243g1 [Pyricularia oryzae Y34]